MKQKKKQHHGYPRFKIMMIRTQTSKQNMHVQIRVGVGDTYCVCFDIGETTKWAYCTCLFGYLEGEHYSLFVFFRIKGLFFI